MALAKAHTGLFGNWSFREVPQDIKEGTKVKATYEPKDGKMVLTKIEVIK